MRSCVWFKLFVLLCASSQYSLASIPNSLGLLLMSSDDVSFGNSTIISVNTMNGAVANLFVFDEVFSYESTFNPQSNMYYLFAETNMYTFDASRNGTLVSNISLGCSPRNTELQVSSNIIFGVLELGVANQIVSIAPSDGSMTVHAVFDATWSVLDDSSTVDEHGKVYYTTVNDNAGTNYLLAVDLTAVNKTRIIAVAPMSPAVFWANAPAGGQIIGYSELDNAIALLNPTTGKSVVIIPGVQTLPEFGGLVLDATNALLYLVSSAAQSDLVDVYSLRTMQRVHEWKLPQPMHFLAFFPTL
eukprot:TRINITY_DN15097_c0_g1_i1.p1 TRINITY_DN15097_c0_g1~~TRINITY_DN15097_c0_g1_i1.p1  ORF type:complete len:301 (+),score=50.63 TRINITY_DN15097_c0_g1_i1:79-981(+)